MNKKIISSEVHYVMSFDEVWKILKLNDGELIGVDVDDNLETITIRQIEDAE